MGKAFSDEERAAVQDKLRRAGLVLFAEKGIRGVSVRELTNRAGISQGGFYTFYKDKEEFIIDLIELRITEKLADMERRMEDTLADPAGYIAGMLYREGTHLKDNKAFDNMISGTLEFFANHREVMTGRVSALYRGFYERLDKYWRGMGLGIETDIDGLINATLAAAVLFSNASLLNGEYFDAVYKTFCFAEARRFVRAAQ